MLGNLFTNSIEGKDILISFYSNVVGNSLIFFLHSFFTINFIILITGIVISYFYFYKKSFQLKIYIASLIIRFELGDFDTIESRLKYMQRVYKEILENDDFKRDVELIEIISKLIYCNNLQQDKKLLMKVKTLITAIDDDAADDADVINYNLWLKSKL